MKYMASVSWGKDSLCMLLELIRRNEPLDEVVFFDTGMEFQAIYDMRDKMLPVLREKGITYKELYPENPFEWMMFEKPVNGTKNGFHYGYSWCGGNARWGTTEKLKALDEYCGDNIVYIGIAHDEWERLQKERKYNKRVPFVEWGITEGEALLYCYQHGFTWTECGKPLYAILDRASCWCCANKNISELRNYFKYLPEYWTRLKELQLKTDRPMKGKGKSVFDLERRFIKEFERIEKSEGAGM